MSTEIIEKIDRNNVRHMMVLSCAPLLAGLKTASLFVTSISNFDEVVSVLKGSGVEILVLCKRKGKITLLLFDRAKLESYLNKNMNASFMRKMGYRTTDVDQVLEEFCNRYRQYLNEKMDFPHEMGIILGYPLEDVNGFMCNEGRNYILSGYWKVYDKPTDACRIFKEYDDAIERMITELVS